MKYVLATLALLLAAPAVAQLQSDSLIVAKRFESIYPNGEAVQIAGGYHISVYYAGTPLQRPRFLAMGPNNTVYVADLLAGHISALLDTNHDGVADSVRAVTPPLDTIHSLAFYQGALYAAEPTRVRKFRDTDGDGFFETEDPFITGIGARGPYNHFTRTILLDSIGKSIYLSVGASCNACRDSDSERATILRFNLDGSGRRVYASGLRNALGLSINPQDSQLWCTNADRDALGDDVPLEIITPVIDGGFYGWPLAYDNKQWDNFQADSVFRSMLPITAADSAKVAGMQIAPIMIEPHSTPMAMLFYQDPRTYIQPPPVTAFVAVHGSSRAGRPVGLGYKVIQLVKDAVNGWQVSDFLTGFLTDSIHYNYWGRPCGLAQDSSGDIFLTSDAGIPAVFRISLNGSDGVKSITPTPFHITISPNPSQDQITITLSTGATANVSLVDALGRTVLNQEVRTSAALNVRDLPNGSYFLTAVSNGLRTVQPIAITR